MFRTDTLQITPEILGLIARIDEFKGAWRALGTLAPDSLSALRRVATIESIGSSTRIEGSKLSDREIERLLCAVGYNLRWLMRAVLRLGLTGFFALCVLVVSLAEFRRHRVAR